MGGNNMIESLFQEKVGRFITDISLRDVEHAVYLIVLYVNS